MRALRPRRSRRASQRWSRRWGATPVMGQRRRSRAGDAAQSTPRAQMKTLNVEVPGYAWIAIKTLAAQQMVSVRHVIMSALKANGIEIKDADMIEDGRRLRGPEPGQWT